MKDGQLNLNISCFWAVIVGNAVDVPCGVRLVPIERRRPVVTEGARIEETRTIHEAGGGKEDAVNPNNQSGILLPGADLGVVKYAYGA